jgi:xanthine dehydrogenase accessory factor
MVWILIDGSPAKERETWRLLSEALLARRSGVLATQIDRRPEGQAGIIRFWLGEEKPDLEPGSALGGFGREVAKVRREDKPMLLPVEGPGPKVNQTLHFLEPVTPLPRLLVVGAGHIGQAVARQARWLGFEVTVIDDRSEFARPERFDEGTKLIVSDIETAVRNFPTSSDTYIVIVTRGHRHDAEALRACIHSPAAYLGMIGSRHKIALLKERFLSAGWASAPDWKRIHAPIGLKIGSKTVEEIAVSIAAELVQVRSRVRELRAGESR